MRRDAEATETTAVDLAEAPSATASCSARPTPPSPPRSAWPPPAKRLADLDPGELAEIHPALAAADRSVLSVEGSLAAASATLAPPTPPGSATSCRPRGRRLSCLKLGGRVPARS